MKAWAKIWVTAVLMMAPATASGSEGTQSPFIFGAGARELALGGAAMTGPDEATMVFWNPSHLILAQRISITGMYSELLIDGAVYQYVGITVPTLDLGGFGLGFFRQSIQNIEKRDDFNTYLGEFDDSHVRLYLGYGRRLAQFEIGAALSLDHQSIDTYRATSSPGLTLATSYGYDPTPPWLTDAKVSVVARNLLKPGIELAQEVYRYPTSLDLGGSVRIIRTHSTDHALEPYLTLHKTESIPLQLFAGVEYTYKQLLQLRGGIRHSHFSFGAGLNLGGISFDYALVDRDLDFVHLFALSGSFGASVDDRRKDRADQLEAEFRQTMNNQIRERNRALMDELLAEGRQQLASGRYEEAIGSFDRLVFLARSVDVDDAAYAQLLDSALQLQTSSETAKILEATLDSANACLASGDFVSARYHARKALDEDPSNNEARRVFEKADENLKVQARRAEFVSEQLERIDALIDSHRFDQADLVLSSLTETAPGDDAVMRRINRLELERLRHKIADLESQRLDTAAQAPEATPTPGERHNVASAQTPMAPLSGEEEVRMRQVYQEAKHLFNSGNIRAAVERWEVVHNRAPDFLSVGEFLVKAYKFLGLELYGQKQRAEAIAVWKKALSIEPDNADIAEYIKRAETQMKKLEELAHEPTR